MTLYPIHYGTRRVTLSALRAAHEPRMHPEFAARLFAWIEHKGGSIGIGGGFRTTQPDRPGFAPDGKSFHQLQRWASGIDAYAAVDLVKVNAGKVHVAPDWADTDDAALFDLHTFIRTPPEPWHMQPIEIRGWSSWVYAGRLDPVPHFTKPTPPPPPDPNPEPDPAGDEPVLLNYVRHQRHAAAYAQWSNGTKTWIPDPATMAVFRFIDPMPVAVMPDDAWMKATGPIVGPIPPGVDAWGIPHS